MKKNIAVLAGDGIGPEITSQAVKVLNTIAEEFGHEFNYKYCLVGADAIDKTGNPLPDETIAACRNSDAILFGTVGHPKYDNDPSATVRPELAILKLRQLLGLYLNIRPIKPYPALQHLSPLKPTQLEDVDLIILRELTGGIYFGKKELSANDNHASDDCSYSREAIERATHLAFEYARQRKKKVTLVDKANVMETSRLWRKVVKEIAAGYPDVKLDLMFVDYAAVQIIMNPKQFDVILTENLFGDIIGDEATVLSGSLGLLASATIGSITSLFEPVHGSYPQAAGKDIANPVGSILSAALMLDHFGLNTEAQLVRDGVEWTFWNGFVTKDIDPVNFYFTSTIGELVSDFISNRIPNNINRTSVDLKAARVNPNEEVVIYLPENDIPLFVCEEITIAAAEFLESLGYELETEDDPVFSSFFKKLKFVFTKKITEKELEKLYDHGKKALELKHIELPTAEQTDKLATAAERLINSLGNVQEGVVRCGVFIVLKKVVNGETRIIVQQLTQEMIVILDKRPDLVFNLNTIYELLTGDVKKDKEITDSEDSAVPVVE
jgi:3-isopropylmalate dehydrogenase